MADNFFGITDTGKMRSNNEDTFIAKTLAGGRFIAACVIDGVGGYEGGEVAARLAHDAIAAELSNNVANTIDLLHASLAAANTAIFREKKTSGANGQMACVLTLALADIDNNKFYYAHVGDTRLYLLRDNSLVKISHDHSFVGFLEDSGRLSEDAAMKHPKRNEINKALGFSEHLAAADYIETGESPFLPGDTLLLCSDGLTDMVSNSSMSDILSAGTPLAAKAKTLIDAANAAGGTDNITVVLVQNDKAPTQHIANRPAAIIGGNTTSKNEPIVSEIRKDPAQTAALEATRKRKKFPILTVLLVLILTTIIWLIYQNYHNSQLHDQEVHNTVVTHTRSAAEQLLLDSIKSNTTSEVFMLTQPGAPPVVITDSIIISKDSLHIIGNSATLTSDTAFKGAAFIMAPTCRYLLLDSLTLENFDIGILLRNKGLHLKSVQFKNCRIPVQYNLLFPQRPVVNGRFADTIFYNSDTLQNLY